MRTCMQKYKNHKEARITGYHFPRPKGTVGSIIHLDLAGPMPRSESGNVWILGIQDNFSRYTLSVAIPYKTHKVVADAFIKNWIHIFGTPTCLVSYNKWAARVFTSLCKQLRINHPLSPHYNPRSNAQIERWFGTIKRLAQAVTRGLNQSSWDKWLPSITFSTNITINQMTGLTLYFMMYNREARVPLTALVGHPEPI